MTLFPNEDAGTSFTTLMPPPHHTTRKSELWPFSVAALSSHRIYGWVVGGRVAGRVNVLWMMFFPSEDAGTSSTMVMPFWPFSVVSLSSQWIGGWMDECMVAGRVNVFWMMFFPNEDAGTSSMTLTTL